MKEVFEKIIEKLEERKQLHERLIAYESKNGTVTEEFQARKAVEVVENAIEIVKQEVEKYNSGWIPVEEELPKYGDNRYYMCIVENHEEDPPMYCQYDEECGFGFYQDIYDEHTLGFVDCEFNTNEELGYEKVIAWQQLLPYQPKGE